MTFAAAVAAVKAGLARPLPGAAAHARLTPRPRFGWPAGFDRANIRDAAALLLVFPVDDHATIVLTVRADTLGRHGGQVSLPGGVIDAGETPEEAAVREAHEEIGVAPSLVRTIGALTPIEIPVSGFRLHPIVGVSQERPAFAPHHGEVARVVEVPIDELADPGALTVKARTINGRATELPVLTVGGVEVWGATGMVLAEFLALFPLA